MGNLGYGEILLIAVVGLLVFGPNKIPELARSCGKAVNAFKKGLKDTVEDEKSGETVKP